MFPTPPFTKGSPITQKIVTSYDKAKSNSSSDTLQETEHLVDTDIDGNYYGDVSSLLPCHKGT